MPVLTYVTSEPLVRKLDYRPSLLLGRYEQQAEQVLYDLWYEYAERLFKRVMEVCEIDKEREEVLRQLFLRPNDFVVEIR
jgi:hypothetical protein